MEMLDGAADDLFHSRRCLGSSSIDDILCEVRIEPMISFDTIGTVRPVGSHSTCFLSCVEIAMYVREEWTRLGRLERKCSTDPLQETSAASGRCFLPSRPARRVASRGPRIAAGKPSPHYQAIRAASGSDGAPGTCGSHRIVAGTQAFDPQEGGEEGVSAELVPRVYNLICLSGTSGLVS